MLFPTPLPCYVSHASFRRHSQLELPLSCEVVEKGGLGPPILRGEDTQISDMHFQMALISEHVAGFC